MQRYQTRKPEQHKKLMKLLKVEKKDIEKEIALLESTASPDMFTADKEQIRQLKRRLWALVGILDHGFDPKMLIQVVD